MAEQKLSDSHHLPVYNIKAVSRLVGVQPVTLRAWERRYNLPVPLRGVQGYRLYSEYDLKILRWLKTQTDSGMAIGRAVEFLRDLQLRGNDPGSEATPVLHSTEQPASIQFLVDELYMALTSLNEARALDAMRRSYTLFPVDQVLTEIIQPVLIEIGEDWQSGQLSIGVEHYASQFFIQNLMSMLAASAPPSRAGVILAACAPGEMHQIGLLMVVLMLRWRGWDVRYLGQNLRLERMEEIFVSLKARLILFSATRLESAKALEGLPVVLEKLGTPRPLVVLGGQAFKEYRLPEHIQAVYPDHSPAKIIETIEQLMSSTEEKLAH